MLNVSEISPRMQKTNSKSVWVILSIRDGAGVLNLPRRTLSLSRTVIFLLITYQPRFKAVETSGAFYISVVKALQLKNLTECANLRVMGFTAFY